MPRSWGRSRYGIAFVLGFLALACGEDREPSPQEPPPSGGPLLSEDLHSHCFRWPEARFSRQRPVDIVTGLAAGDRAVEFELLDLDGNPTRLSDLLREKPVLLVLGSFT